MDEKYKHIEEMVSAVCIQVRDYPKLTCKMCKNENSSTNAYCRVQFEMERLYTAGYRKASDLAREIFEEIEEIAMHSITSFGLQTMVMGEVAFAELKKKYTESENNDG